jgi:hypothetical protein
LVTDFSIGQLSLLVGAKIRVAPLSKKIPTIHFHVGFLALVARSTLGLGVPLNTEAITRNLDYQTAKLGVVGLTLLGENPKFWQNSTHCS